MFSHWDAMVLACHVTLQTDAGAHITATAGHYVYLTRGPAATHALGSHAASLDFSRHASIVRMDDVRPGDVVWAQGLHGKMQPQRVVSKTESLEKGLYNPHTPSGSLLVDSIAALTFSDVIPPSAWWHAFVTAPGRVAFALTPSLGLATQVNKALLFSWPARGIECLTRVVVALPDVQSTMWLFSKSLGFWRACLLDVLCVTCGL